MIILVVVALSLVANVLGVLSVESVMMVWVGLEIIQQIYTMPQSI